MLTATVQSDPAYPYSRVRIAIDGLAATPSRADVLLVRENFADPFLGPDGWRTSETILSPLDAWFDGSARRLCIVLGRTVCQYVEPGPLRVRLCAGGGEAEVFWPEDIALYDDGSPEPAPLPLAAPVRLVNGAPSVSPPSAPPSSIPALPADAAPVATAPEVLPPVAPPTAVRAIEAPAAAAPAPAAPPPATETPTVPAAQIEPDDDDTPTLPLRRMNGGQGAALPAFAVSEGFVAAVLAPARPDPPSDQPDITPPDAPLQPPTDAVSDSASTAELESSSEPPVAGETKPRRVVNALISGVIGAVFAVQVGLAVQRARSQSSPVFKSADATPPDKPLVEKGPGGPTLGPAKSIKSSPVSPPSKPIVQSGPSPAVLPRQPPASSLPLRYRSPEEIIAAVKDPAALVEYGRTKLEQRDPTGADRLFEEAERARGGDRVFGPAAVERGKLFDPSLQPSSAVPRPDAGFAAERYRNAIDRAAEPDAAREARSRLDALRAWLLERSRAGDVRSGIDLARTYR